MFGSKRHYKAEALSKHSGGISSEMINLLLSCLQWVMCLFVFRDEL